MTDLKNNKTASAEGGYDKILLLLFVTLLTIGWTMVGSSSMAVADALYQTPFYFLIRHSVYIGLGLLGFLLALNIDSQRWYDWSGWCLLAGLILLSVVWIPGVGHTVNGSTRWLKFAGITLQVSECVKFFMIAYLSGYLVRRHDELRGPFKGFLKPLLVLGLITFLLLLEPDFGAAAVMLATALGMLFLAGAKLWQFILLSGVVVSALALLAVAAPYRLQRLTVFLDPWADPFGSGYQLTQSLIAFGRGGIWGEGLGQSLQKWSYLPEAHTDFIMAILAEELGLIGMIACILVLLFFCLRLLNIARLLLQAKKAFQGYFVAGVSIWFALQSVINIGVNAGLFPTKGLTLPFISYGGTSLLISCFVFGIVMRMDYERRVVQSS